MSETVRHYKKGRKPALFNMHSMRAMHAALDHMALLGVPPAASNDYVSPVDKHTGGDWGMMLNNSQGDCTCADSGHTLMLRSANTSTMIVTADSVIQTMYSAVSGFDPRRPALTDNGAEETTVCRYMETVGLMGHKSVASAPLFGGKCAAHQLDLIRWTVQMFGHCRIGVDLPNSAEEQFDAGLPWDINGDLTIDGGHDVPIVKYDGQYFYCVTWGKLQRITIPWMLRFCEEAHIEAFPDIITQQQATFTKFNFQNLLADIAQMH